MDARTTSPDTPLLTALIHGEPIPQGSKSLSRSGHMYESNTKLRPWRNHMTATLRAAYTGTPVDAPVTVDATFTMPRPKRPRWWAPAVKPDVDKLQRALGDALEAAGVLDNDSRITDWHARVRYAPEGQPPGVRVAVALTQHDKGQPWMF